jgi:hypothetical protein
VGEVELDRSAAARIQVDEQRAQFRVQHVAWVRLAVQQLLGGVAVLDGLSQVPQPAAEEVPVRVGEGWRAGDVPGNAAQTWMVCTGRVTAKSAGWPCAGGLARVLAGAGEGLRIWRPHPGISAGGYL